MKPGLGLYRHMLTEDNLSFARQAGAPDVDVYEAMARFASQDRCVRVWDPGELGFLS
jgi:hypothetical protein